MLFAFLISFLTQSNPWNGIHIFGDMIWRNNTSCRVLSKIFDTKFCFSNPQWFPSGPNVIIYNAQKVVFGSLLHFLEDIDIAGIGLYFTHVLVSPIIFDKFWERKNDKWILILWNGNINHCGRCFQDGLAAYLQPNDDHYGVFSSLQNRLAKATSCFSQSTIKE